MTVEKLGNDLAIRLPRDLAKRVGFRAGTKLEIDILVDQLNVRRFGAPRRRSKYRLSDLLRKWKGGLPSR